MVVTTAAFFTVNNARSSTLAFSAPAISRHHFAVGLNALLLGSTESRAKFGTCTSSLLISSSNNGNAHNTRSISSSPLSSSSTSIPEALPHLSTIQPALSAIRKACRITSYLQPTTVDSKISGLVKKDASPVTIGDFSAQALVLNLLKKEFKGDVFVAEEGSKALVSEGEDLSIEILKVLKHCGYEAIIDNTDELKRSIDLGQSYQPNGKFIDAKHHERVWCLDPIDGTRGFLRGKKEGGQYCIALALIEDGIPVVGILGCPNLPVSPTDQNYAWSSDETSENNKHSRGCIIIASKNGGCYQLPLYPSSDDDDCSDSSFSGAIQIQVTQNDGKGVIKPSQSRFCIGVEKYSDPEGKLTSIAQTIHGELDSDGDILYSRRMDSQVKYGVLARGGAEMFARLPKKSYVEWIWDHAAGRIVIEEAGGIQTDTNGKLIDYGLGAKMDDHVDGILASPGGVFHDALLNAVERFE